MAESVFVNGKKTHVDFDKLPDNSDIFFFDKGSPLVFTEESAKTKWLNSTGFSIYYKQGLNVLAKIKSVAKAYKNEEEAAKQFKTEEQRIRRKIQAMFKKHGINPSSAQEVANFLCRYDSAVEVHPMSTFLYDSRQFEGDWRYLRHGINIPKFSWIGFQDRTTSVRVFGETTVLCQLAWWRGYKAWVGGYPYREEDFYGRWFDNRASSSFSF